MLKKEKGITLIVLVITIVILLILAGIAIISITGEHGLMQIAKDAKKNTIEAEEKEEKTLSEYEDYIDEEIYGEGKTTLARKVKVGDYVKYTPDTVQITDTEYTGLISELGEYSGSSANTSSTLTQEKLNWRVLDVQNGEVRLISEEPTTSTIELKGASGYNNEVYLIDKTCSILYNNSKYAKKVQNLKIEDIQNYLKWDYKSVEYNSSIYYPTKYGEFTEEPFTSNTYYPTIYSQEKNNGVGGTQNEGTLGQSEQETPIPKSNESGKTSSLGVTITGWGKIDMDKTCFKKAIYSNLFINYEKNDKKWYYLSSRNTVGQKQGVTFNIYQIRSGNGGGVGCTTIYVSSGYNDQKLSGSYRPVVTLKADTLTNITDKDGSSAEKAYELVKQD